MSRKATAFGILKTELLGPYMRVAGHMRPQRRLHPLRPCCCAFRCSRSGGAWPWRSSSIAFWLGAPPGWMEARS